MADDLARWLERSEQLNHYELLGVDASSTPGEVQSAFHRFSERFHPDQHVRSGERVRDDVRQIFKRGAEAYRVLKSPKLRSEYDLRLATQKAGAGGSRARALDEVCLTAAGRLHARQADAAIGEGRLIDAAALLEKALRAEGDNQELRERLSSLRAFLTLSGDS